MAAVTSIVIVVSPLNALMSNQISRLNLCGVRASILSVKNRTDVTDPELTEENMDVYSFYTCDFGLCQEDKLRNGHYHIVFAHPETFISTKYGRELLLSKIYKDNVVAIVVDEAHCILDWGNDFREDYGKLGVLCSLFPDRPVIAMTATASHSDVKIIEESLRLKKCKYVISNPDRRNIFYKKVFRTGQDIDAVQSILLQIAKDLLDLKVNYPLTIIYTPLKWCGFAYKLFEYVLGSNQYFPKGSIAIPANRLFAQFHAPQTNQMKEEILRQLCSSRSIVRVVFATVAMGMGVDIPDIRTVIHLTPPCTVKAYFQETGRAGRDGKSATAILYYNNRDVAKNMVNMTNDMRVFCSNDNHCLRSLLLKSLDYDQNMDQYKKLHLCCSVCEKICECSECV